MSVPQLRFKQFHDEWLEISLGDVSKNVMYGMNAAAIPFDGLNKYIRITDIDEETRAFIPSPLTSPDGKIENKYKLKNGDIVFARTGASVGKSYLYKEKDGNLLFAGFLVKFSITDAHPYFVYTNTLTESYKGWVTIMSMRSGQPGVNAEELKEYKFLTPGVPEQTKIASFLTVVDEKISQFTQKCELLAQYKKGVMQQIFSQELRFKDEAGRDFPEWEDKKLKDIAHIVGGGTPETGVKEYWNGDIQWFTPTELKSKYAAHSQRTITESGFKNSSAKILPVGALLFSSRATVGDVSIALKPCTTNQGFQSLIVNDENNNEFIYYWILNNKKVFLEKASGSTFLEISKKEIEKLKIQLPSITEQAKIASFLTAIDDKIANVQAQLAAAKQYKQGLLQQMFV